MKRPFAFLMFLIFYLAVFFGIAFPIGMWLILKDVTFSSTEIIHYVKQGVFFGIFTGIMIWIMYRLQIGQRR